MIKTRRNYAIILKSWKYGFCFGTVPKQKMKKLGMSEGDDADPESGDHADHSYDGQSTDEDDLGEDGDSQGNRWLRMLGR
jgi:hypothetical protein